MAVTIFGSYVDWGDGSTTSTASQAGSISAVDSQSGITVSSFQVGTYQLIRTTGFLENNSYGGQFSGCYYLNSSWVGIQNSSNYFNYSPCVVTYSNIGQDYNSHWWYIPNNTYGFSIPNLSGSIAQLTGTWKSRGQCVGRGIVSPRYGNFAMMQRVA